MTRGWGLAGAALLGAALVACGGTAGSTPTTAAPISLAPTSSAPTADPPAEVGAVLALLDRLNAAAGGPVEEQRSVIEASLDPGQLAAQASCGTATTTLSFGADAGRARQRPDWSPPAGTVNGTVWGIPVLMRIHSGDRIVGTDLTELHVVVGPDGTARLPAMCIN